MQRTFYALAIQGSGTAELTSGNCLYRDYRLAEKRLKEFYHANGMNYVKIFNLELQDDDAVVLDQSRALGEIP